MALEKTLVLLKPCTLQRALVGEITNIFERKGLRICGMKMMQLTDEILSEHSLPSWHGAKGKEGFLFVDEIMVE